MEKIVKVMAVSVKNGRNYPMFRTSKIIEEKDLWEWMKDLQEKYDREFYPIYGEIGCEDFLPKNSPLFADFDKWLAEHNEEAKSEYYLKDFVVSSFD